MRIFVVGNINSGKSYTVKKLSQIFPDYPVLAIDQYRIKYADGSIEKEEATRKRFANDIIQNKDAIIEFTGGSNITDLFMDKIRQNSSVVLEIKANIGDCLKRIEDKDFSIIPYPTYTETIEETIIRLDRLFISKMIDSNFNRVALKHFVITSDYDVQTLPLRQCEHAIKIADSFENMSVALFSFGSLSNVSLNRYSDVDLFIKTYMPVDSIMHVVKNLYPKTKTIIQQNQIALYEGEDLIEINVISDLIEAQLFYCNSEVMDIEKTILLNEEGLLEGLTKLVETYDYDVNIKITKTLSRLSYYYCSLPRIKQKGDLYKYFFHTNILIHEYVRLNYLLKGYTAFSYLPKQATKYIDKATIQTLIYNLDDDISMHLSKIKPFIETVIKQANMYLSKVKLNSKESIDYHNNGGN